MATSEPVVLHHGREGGGDGHDEARPSASTACWAGAREASVARAGLRPQSEEFCEGPRRGGVGRPARAKVERPGRRQGRPVARGADPNAAERAWTSGNQVERRGSPDRHDEVTWFGKPSRQQVNRCAVEQRGRPGQALRNPRPGVARSGWDEQADERSLARDAVTSRRATSNVSAFGSAGRASRARARIRARIELSSFSKCYLPNVPPFSCGRTIKAGGFRSGQPSPWYSTTGDRQDMAGGNESRPSAAMACWARG